MLHTKPLKPYELEEKIFAQLRQKSGLVLDRKYLGMSQIGRCPVVIYRNWFTGVDGSNFFHRMAYTGYMHELDVLTRLREIGVARLDRREMVADFDDRFRGHIDGVTEWGDLLEIKSVSAHKYEMVCYHNRALHEHNDQVQMYMLYGGFRYAWFIYVNRESFEHKVIRVPFFRDVAAKLVEKAKRVLAAIDSGVEPECECGRCQVEDSRFRVERNGE